MALIRYLLMATVWLSACVNLQAQTVYYPAEASQLLRSTADDIAMLLQQAIPGGHFITEPYSSLPGSGIILQYDASVPGNQACRVQSNGTSTIRFAASQDNGLSYGVYEYLHQLGFRFYQPGTAWQLIPALQSFYTVTDTLYNCRFKYKNWFISGGYNKWAMDNNADFYWDTYYGEMGHEWSLYQRRNNMVGEYRFAGHRDDIMNETYLSTLQSNPCYVAPYNGSRVATRQSVADVNNTAAMQLWSSSIEEQYTKFRNHIFTNSNLYTNYYHNFNFAYGNIGIEVPDGAHWANTNDNSCGNNTYAAESDQHFTLANYTAEKIAAIYPGKRFQLYAYDGHANIPAAGITINPGIDVQVVATAFQQETSPKGLLNRWYGKSKNLSEYHYLNLAQWSGETPSFYLADLEQTVARLKEKNAQGIVWEASPAKFTSLPFLLAANEALKNGVSIETKLKEFCNNLFGPAAAAVYQLLNYWSNDKTVMLSNGIGDNKYKLPLYFQLLGQANAATQQSPPVVKERIRELKAYLHYMSLYLDWVFDQRAANEKSGKAAALCLYLAKINRLQIVNSYALINSIVNRYNNTDDVHIRFNAMNGTAYQNGNLHLITPEEIDADFASDAAVQNNLVGHYSFSGTEEIKDKFAQNQLDPAEKINLQLNYTNGKDYGARSEIFILAEKAGNFTIKYTPKFGMPGKGYINFTVEAVDNVLGIVKDFSIGTGSSGGVLYIALPQAGTYKLSFVSKYKSTAAITITTNGNYFFRNGPFLGNTVENYRGDLTSLPGFFYVPPGIEKIYFSLNNSNPGGAGFASTEEISKSFAFRDHRNYKVEPVLAGSADSALFYLPVPVDFNGGFWQAFKMEQYRLCFANISNIQWYAKRRPCAAAEFTASIRGAGDNCTTQLKTAASGNLQWEIYDAQKWYNYNFLQQVELPLNISPNAVVTLTTAEGCSVTRRISENPDYLRQKAACASGATPAEPGAKVLLYPNPGNGVFKCMQNGEPALAEEIIIHNASGAKMAGFANTEQFNITALPPGMYFYTLIINKIAYKGKVVKL